MRKSGILLHISSLPSPYGIGTLGAAAYKFADFLHAAGQRVWQLLPVGPTSFGDSPYQSFSTFAGNPYFIDLDMLVAEGLLTRDEISSHFWGADPARVDYAAVYENRFAVLRLACARDGRAGALKFREENPWVDDYALFMALKDENGSRPWECWDAPLRRRDADAVAEARVRLADDVYFYTYLQYQFHRQWSALREYVNSLGISLVGDLPIYVPYDSADVWCSRSLFALDKNGAPTAVAGCPPDYFSEDGQLWGNPLYAWERHSESGFAWWMARLRAAAELFDTVRIDHFRGLESFWAIPAGDTTARFGRWVKGPGRAFIDAVRENFPGTGIIAEDLGFLTEEVLDLVRYSGFPGMKVMEFAFDGDDGSLLPKTYPKNSVCYLGTHDNDTLLSWLATAPPRTRENALRYFGIADERSLPEAMLRAGMACLSDLFVMQMQDVLGLGGEARMNLPGTLSTDNWSWRLPQGALSPALASSLHRLTENYGR